jgi:sedoheptulokinase
MGSTLYWLTQKNALPANTARVTFIHDWIAALFTDQLPVTDPSDAGSAGIFDLAQLTWHEKLIKDLDLPGDLLPPVRESGEVIGRLSEKMAEETGLPAGIPVCNAIGDNQASVLGAVSDVDKTLLLNLGTGGQISWAVPEFIRVPEMETRYLPCKRYMLVGASLCGGAAFAWLNDVITSWLRTFNIQVEREETYEKLVKLASTAPAGAEGLKVRTTFTGKRTDPNLRGAIEGISLDNFTLDNLARAVLEGVVEELCGYYDIAGHKAAGRHENVVASGNAVRKNALLREIIGQRLHLPVLVPCHREEAAGGAALLAGVNAKLWPDLENAGKCVQYISSASEEA